EKKTLENETKNLYEKKHLNLIGILSIFEKLMSEDVHTLLVFNNSQDLSPVSLRELFSVLKNRLTGWALKNIRSVNKCLFIFNSPDKNTLKEVIKNNSLDFLANYLLSQEKRDSRSIIHVGYPD